MSEARAAAAPLIRVIPRLAPPELHKAVWEACTQKRWYFGNQSVTADAGIPFWKMDLDGDAAVGRLWTHAKQACEKAAGRALRVVRQYANGHTYGLGGRPHSDDDREGTFTLLYYPMPLWKPDWEGETLFYDARLEVIAGVKPAPNRAVFFDSRIPHSGRAPSRSCGALRITLAFKLESA
ncbi:MAG: hypothetical protein A3D95_11235 [Betaproteobacteria bacterium RIFCSPHIGHO2_12_FULL_69_13]|nr:MAG: hypothetical protein A3D95_11235 [Betaproteobacteria bacterium RIFCSPHIGHO2_12_FULL_69_13]OGA69598.1 MAG: hypothetical protein A3G83_14170 [Betaproteobacteria bacterium RIFCSPLOWO2_12_FULL_68_20]